MTKIGFSIKHLRAILNVLNNFRLSEYRPTFICKPDLKILFAD
jgi:hypothetical protein